MKVDGACFCGDLTFEAEIDPAKVELCNCEDCQTISSSAFRIVVPALAGSFKLLSGQPAIYVKTAASGNKRNLAFCPRCGTAIYSGPADSKSTFFGLRVGTLRQRRELEPKTQYWLRSALSWVGRISAIPGHQSE